VCRARVVVVNLALSSLTFYEIEAKTLACAIDVHELFYLDY
jgi:hypothetical protein